MTQTIRTGDHRRASWVITDPAAVIALSINGEEWRPAREAEREATPPSAGDGDEAWRHCRWNEPHKAVPKPGSEVDVVRATGREGAECATCGEALWRGDRKTPLPFAPPAPVDEAAVEALARVLVDHHSGTDIDATPWDRAVAEVILGALDRGEVRGYGPTGASVGAGEVARAVGHLAAITRGLSAAMDGVQQTTDACRRMDEDYRAALDTP